MRSLHMLSIAVLPRLRRTHMRRKKFNVRLGGHLTGGVSEIVLWHLEFSAYAKCMPESTSRKATLKSNSNLLL